jgi:ketosteroid isomerase-like protein
MQPEETNMKDSKTLLLAYLASIRDPERAAALFAEDGVFELPYLRSLGVGPRYVGRREITALLNQLLKLYPNFAFAPDDIRILIETPDKTFAEYVAHARAAATGRTLHQLFTGYLVAEAGQIKLIREMLNPLAMAQAQLANGVAEIGPPGNEVHSF